MLHHERREKTRHTPLYGIIAVCDSPPRFIGEVLDISAKGVALKCLKRPAKKTGPGLIRLMGAKEMRINDIPMEILYISKKSLAPSNRGHHNNHFYRIGIRLTPETKQEDKTKELIEVIM